MAESNVLLVTVTHDREEVARDLARSAVEARLAACAQISAPITSVYWWDGRIEESREWAVWMKTTTERYAALQEHLLAEHPYDVPEIVATPVVDGNPAYLAWVSEETLP